VIYIHISFISFEPPLRHARSPRRRGSERGADERRVYVSAAMEQAPRRAPPIERQMPGSLLRTMSVNEGRMRYYYSFNSILSTRRDVPRAYAWCTSHGAEKVKSDVRDRFFPLEKKLTS